MRILTFVNVPGTVEMLNIHNISAVKYCKESSITIKHHLTKDQQVAELKFSFEVLSGGRCTTWTEQNKEKQTKQREQTKVCVFFEVF